MPRARKAGKRTASGRLSRAGESWLNKVTIMERRCDVLGWKKTRLGQNEDGTPILGFTYDQLLKADKWGGTHWGMTFLAGAISEAQHRAADECAVITRAYLSAIGAPPVFGVSATEASLGGRGVGPEYPERDKRNIAVYEALRGATGRNGISLIQTFLDGRPVNMEQLRAVLDIAADHLGLAEVA